MILIGNQRGGARDLARHLMKHENERVEVNSVRGFVSRSLDGAFQESYAISRATKCKQHLYSLSLNPPQDAEASNADFEKAIEVIEERLNLAQQPRIVVFHEKYGEDGKLRRHAHAVWCRIDRQAMKAVEMSFDKDKLRSVARGLYVEHGWKMPLGFVKTEWRNPTNFTLAEWQQSKRAGKDAKKLKAMLQERWAISDSKASFAAALEEQGFILAKGDRRGFVAVDHDGEAYPITRWVGVKAKQVRARLGEPNDLPSVSEAHQTAASLVVSRLAELNKQQGLESDQIRETARKDIQAEETQRERALSLLQQEQAKQEKLAEEQRQSRLRQGLWGIWDRLTGRRKRTLTQNQRERDTASRLHAREQEVLKAEQSESIQAIRKLAAKQIDQSHATQRELKQNILELELPFKTASEHSSTEKRTRSQDLDRNGKAWEPEP